MNFLCGPRTFWLSGLPKVTEYRQVDFISRSMAIFPHQDANKEARRGAAGSIACFGTGRIFRFLRDSE